MSFSDEPKKLGKLSQSARKKKLNQLRGILFFVGIITIAANAFQLANLDKVIRKAVDDQIKKEGINPALVDPVEKERVIDEAKRIGALIGYGLIAVGVVYVIFGCIVHKFPVPISILALVMYVAAAVVFAMLDPSSLSRGLIFKIFITIAMIQGVKTAQAYEEERRREQMRDFEDDFDDDYADRNRDEDEDDVYLRKFRE